MGNTEFTVEEKAVLYAVGEMIHDDLDEAFIICDFAESFGIKPDLAYEDAQSLVEVLKEYRDLLVEWGIAHYADDEPSIVEFAAAGRMDELEI